MKRTQIADSLAALKQSYRACLVPHHDYAAQAQLNATEAAACAIESLLAQVKVKV